MFIFSVIAIFITAILIKERFKKELVRTLPIVVGCFILCLYVIAFFRALFLIDFISIGVIAGEIFYLYKNDKLSVLGKALKENVSQLSAIALLLIFLTVCELPRIATWWDDINFWATDAKALYYLNGFAGKYGNVAPEFGDYPPGIQLFKWFFLHFNMKEYTEGLAFGGYLCMNLIFSLPLLKNLKTKNFFINLFACAVLVLFPTVANIICFQGTCADVTMGIIYGALLLSIWDEDADGFYYFSIAIYGCVLVLTKSVGIEWAAFAFIFYLLTCFRRTKEKGLNSRAFLSWGFVIITELSWLIFCLVNRRVSKLTSSGVKMASSGGVDLKGYAAEKARFYLEGFSLYPMHTDFTPLIDLSVLAFLMILIAVVIIMSLNIFIDKDKSDKAPLISKKERKRLLIFIAITAFAAYGIIFLGHITIFATETQYGSGEVMAISISRYGAPFTIGMMMLLIGIITGKANFKRAYLPYIICAAFILLTCDYKGVYEGLISYRNTLSEDKEARNQMVDDNAKILVDKLSKTDELSGKRLLYIRQDGIVHWVHNAYLNLEVSPVPVVYGSAGAESSADDIKGQINASHAAYIYMEEIDGFSDDYIKPETIYRIEKDGSLAAMIYVE